LADGRRRRAPGFLSLRSVGSGVRSTASTAFTAGTTLCPRATAT